MSQLPRYGGQGPKNVTTTTTRTTRIPGTDRTMTQSRTVTADVTVCGTDAQVNLRPGQRGATTRPGATGLRQPSGLRPPDGRQQALVAGHPEACGATTCSAPRQPARPTGLPQVQGLPRQIQAPTVASGQRSVVQQQRTGGLRPPQAPGLRAPVHTRGLPQPQVTGLRPPMQTGIRHSTPINVPQSASASMQSALRQPQTTGLRRPTPTTSLQQSIAGVSRITPQSQPRPISGIRPPGLRPPGGAQAPRRRSPAQQQAVSTRGVCGGPCGPPVQQKVVVQPPTPLSGARPRPVVPQTPAQVSAERVTPSAPTRRLERPTGPEAYKQFIFESKQKLKKPSSPGLYTEAEQRSMRAATAEENAARSLLEKSQANEGAKVTAKAASKSPARVQYVETPQGREPILKQTVLEKRVERDEEGEKIVKNLQILDAETPGQPNIIDMNLQQLDPSYALPQGKEVISIKSTVSVSESRATITKEVSRATTSPVPQAASLPPQEVAKLVEEENEDVENTLKMLPPDLALSPGRYEMKKRLQHLQLNSESVALLEQSIIHPEPRADEAQAEPTPEVMAAMIHTVEKGVPPQSTPDQVFNTLFVETSNENYIKLSPVTQGPLQDVVVPTEVPLDVHKEAISEDMEKLTERLQNIPTSSQLPSLDIFDQIMAEEQKAPSKGKTKDIKFPLISDEKSLWVNANLEHLVNVVGATPVEVLDPANLDELEMSGKLEEQLAAGMEYFVEADPVQYMSRVQLRGTQLPSYFPGYLLALPEFPDVVKIASSPDEVFASAWKSAQPKYFPDESTQSLVY
ncbi:hypothetical protein NQ315_011780 [Exocentrus adspersus]|uniref:Uncharacterized protein n=1 Tax=Exocentrus adspersus TaxID=1586481 RepID=A0AAV8W0L8_9CUCU|nr:hypothetical protein NQ315_011780 [Exocentrus adspersus]